MVEGFYALMKSVGFTHPMHPVLTHAPMGMIIGMLLFGLLSLKWQDKHFSLTAYYCSVVALLSIFPTAMFGIMDWLQFYEGDWLTVIKVKMILTVVLTGLLVFSIILRNRGASRQQLVIVYFLCMACAGGLGYSGGELVYG